LTASGELLELTGGGSDPRFEATAGGMGLTGIIVWARIALRRIRSAILSVDSNRVNDLDETFALLDAISPASGGGAPTGEYRVAWLDLLAGPEPRGVVTRADHLAASDGSLRPGTVTRGALLSVPDGFPAGLLRPSTVRLHNELRWRLAPRAECGRPVPFAAHMFPLDVLGAWPHLYGAAGFLQYQFVVPRGHERTIRLVLARLRSSRIPCFLAVLKDFGAATPSPLSFPLAGWTLALDLPAAAPGLRAALDACDELVVTAGGRVYLAKDARLRPATLEAMYPRLPEWRRVRDRMDPDRVWRSDLAVRTGLVGYR
jgi:decaprenylphospho-beta-D-ribofuranose 2-oxidase